jgi:hypothetical protein
MRFFLEIYVFSAIGSIFRPQLNTPVSTPKDLRIKKVARVAANNANQNFPTPVQESQRKHDEFYSSRLARETLYRFSAVSHE